jgi:hypothetical protein
LHEVAPILGSDQESLVPPPERPKGLGYFCGPGGKIYSIGDFGETRGEIQLTSPDFARVRKVYIDERVYFTFVYPMVTFAEPPNVPFEEERQGGHKIEAPLERG